MLVCESVSDRGASAPRPGSTAIAEKTSDWPKETSSLADLKPGVKDRYSSISQREKVPAGEREHLQDRILVSRSQPFFCPCGVLVEIDEHERMSRSYDRET
jgi:hypothetical protein